MKYYVHWMSSTTGASGHGTKALNRETAEAWVAHGNKEFPCITHWLVSA